jgi:phenylalanyl-tRNA synthetase alpha chain
MEYQNADIAKVAKHLLAKFEQLEDKKMILRAPELAALYDQLKTLPAGQVRADFGKEVNQLRNQLQDLVNQADVPDDSKLRSIDVTAPFDTNVKPDDRPSLLSAESGGIHPLNQELSEVLDIFYRMGFHAEESREIDDDYHMFTSLNFPPDHPARDDYDNRVMQKYKADLEAGKGIRAVVPGRVFRNEDLDARHEHTFTQLEGFYVDEGINAGHLIATLKTFFTAYFKKEVKVKTQPFYFPFTEPSFEFAASCPFCDEKGCGICSYSGWIELLGCGMIHPNVLTEGGIDSSKYTGFAWGGGIERLVMIKYGIEDIRHFHSANLKFLRQFS